MATKTTRGRPAGSGINDDKILKKISNLMNKDPDLKATTAIKAAGITDPSSIRRLRDKLNSSTPAKKAPAKKKASAKKVAAKKAVSTRKAKKATTVKASTKAAPAKKKPAAKKTVTTRTAAANKAAPKKPTGSNAAKKTVKTRKAPSKTTASANASVTDLFKNPFEELTNSISEMAQGMPQMPNGQDISANVADLNIDNIVTSTVGQQIRFYESALKFSPMANLLRQQALLTDMMLTMLRTQKEFTKTMKPKSE